MHMDHHSLMAAMLHDVIEDTETNKEELAQLFGDTVAEFSRRCEQTDPY